MEDRREPLFATESMSGLLISGALAGALVAGPLLASRMASVLASGETSLQQGSPTEPARSESAKRKGPGDEPRLLFPVEAGDRSRFRASFNDPRGGRLHRAVDIFAPRYSPVRAVDAGVVARLLQSGAGGTAIEHADETGRYCYYYAHLDRHAPGLREGLHVERGQVIGYVGTSGNAAQRSPHLHFAVFRSEDGRSFHTDDTRCWSGTALDPYPLLNSLLN